MLGLKDFDVYRLDKDSLGKYGETRLAEILSRKGWKVYTPAFSLDHYVDLVAFKKKCMKCDAKNSWEKNSCKKCQSTKLKKIFRTIQVKTSLIEKGGTDKSFAFNFRPKDLFTNSHHFLIGIVYDVKGKEHTVCCTPAEFAGFSDGGWHVINYSWKDEQARFHPHSDCLIPSKNNNSIPRKFINKLQHLEDELSDVNTLIDKHEMITYGRRHYTYSGLWSTSGDTTVQKKRLMANKRFLKQTLVGDLEKIVNLKTSVLQIIKNKKSRKPLNKKLKTKGKTHFKNKAVRKAFLELQEENYVFESENSNDFLAMKVYCKECKTTWDREEKECYRCKTWQPPLKKCHVCKTIVANDKTKFCKNCENQGVETEYLSMCIKCGCQAGYSSKDAENNMDDTYFLPITFCQKCGKREIDFVFKELK